MTQSQSKDLILMERNQTTPFHCKDLILVGRNQTTPFHCKDLILMERSQTTPIQSKDLSIIISLYYKSRFLTYYGSDTL